MERQRLSSAPFAGGCDAVAKRLAGALAIQTVSRLAPTPEDAEAFVAFHRHLEASFPLVHCALTREKVGDGHALLYTWQGIDPGAEPWLASSHQDVAAAESRAGERWTHPPFGGDVADGQIWGRGALDMKSMLMGWLEAAERLLSEGFAPRRTIYFAFGADEEVGGNQGARQIASLLRSRNIGLDFTLDEGGLVLSGAIPGIALPVAFIGVAEKGELLLRLVAEDSAGHSSLPGATSAVGRLARAIAAIEDHPMPARLEPPVTDTFRTLAPHARRPYRQIYRHCRLFAPLMLKVLCHDPMTATLVRTTMAPTILRAGAAENVIPSMASAVIHVRVRPGDSTEDVLSHLRGLLRRHRVTVEPMEDRRPSRLSATNAPGFAALRDTIGDVMPDAVAAPFLSMNATDSRQYESLARNQYRFLPIHVRTEDVQRIHGTDERISVEGYCGMVRFLAAFIRRVDRSDASHPPGSDA